MKFGGWFCPLAQRECRRGRVQGGEEGVLCVLAIFDGDQDAEPEVVGCHLVRWLKGEVAMAVQVLEA